MGLVGRKLGELFQKKKQEQYENHQLFENTSYEEDNNYDIHEFSGKNKEKNIRENFLENDRKTNVEENDEPEEEVYLKNREEKLGFVEDCCEQIMEASKRSVDAKKEYKAVNGYLEDIRLIKEQEPEGLEALQRSARRIVNLKEDKENYRNFGTKMPESMYYYMQTNEKEMPEILKELHDDENYEQTLKTNLSHIEAEKSALDFERKENQKKISNIRTAAFASIFFALIVLCVISYLHLNTEYDYTIGIMINVVVLAVFLTIFVSMYRKYAGEIKLAERKINKAVGLLNKYRLLYVNVKNRIDYTHEKLKIRNSYELSNYWRIYLTAKKEQKAYQQMSEELYQEQQNFTDMIHGLHLYDESVWNYQMNAIIHEGEMDALVHNLEQRRKGLRKTLDFNKKRSDKCKQKVKNLIKAEPSLAADILKIVEEWEKHV